MNRLWLALAPLLVGCSAPAATVASAPCPPSSAAPTEAPTTGAQAPTPSAAAIALEPYQQGGHRSVDVTVGGQTMPFLGVFDLAALMPPDWPALGGLISLSSFVDDVVKVDLKAGRVEVMSRLDESGGKATPYNAVLQASGYSYVVLVPVDTPSGRLWLELDSGSDAPLILAPHAAKMLGVDLEKAEHHADEKKPEWWSIDEVTLALPGVDAIQTHAKAMDIIYDGNIGAPLMERFIWTIDLPNQRLRVEPKK